MKHISVLPLYCQIIFQCFIYTMFYLSISNGHLGFHFLTIMNTSVKSSV